MPIAIRPIVAGKLQVAFERELQSILRDRLLERLWAKDVSLWPGSEPDHSRIRSNLEWLNLPEGLAGYLEALKREDSAALADGLDQRVLIAFDSANLAARSIFPFVPPSKVSQFQVLDGIEPASIRKMEESIDVRRTLFVFVNKSSYKLEDHALFLHLRALMEGAGIAEPQRQFAAATERRSYLSSMSRSYHFRPTLEDVPGIHASFSSTLHFGAVLTALGVSPPAEIVKRVQAMRTLCSPETPPAENPALQLAAILAAAALSHRRYLVFVTTASLRPYFWRLRQLLAGGLAKGASPLIPIAVEADSLTPPFLDNGVFVILSRIGEEDAQEQELQAKFRVAGIPFAHIAFSEPVALIGDSFKWEVATALASARLGVDPFDASTGRIPRGHAMEILDKFSKSNNTLSRQPRLKESNIQLFAEGATRRELSTLNLVEALCTFLQLRQPGGYLSICAYLEKSVLVTEVLQNLRNELNLQLALPVLLTHGLRPQDSYWHLYTQPRPSGIFLLLTSNDAEDIPIPGAAYSFGGLNRALALGFFDALNQADCAIVHLNLTGNLEAALAELEHLLEQAVQRVKKH